MDLLIVAVFGVAAYGCYLLGRTVGLLSDAND
jgi:hypothetical protein